MTEARPTGPEEDDYHRLRMAVLPGGGTVFVKPGMRGFPGLADGLEPLLARAEGGERLADATGSGGAAAAAAFDAGAVGRVVVAEGSRAALTCAAATLTPDDRVELLPAPPWGLPAAAFDAVWLLPTTDRGSERVRAELRAGARALAAGGTLWWAMHKDRGAKRYEREAARLLDAEVEVVGRSRGWRVARAARGPAADAGEAPWLAFDAAGLELVARPGVHAAGKLDPGTARLLEHVPWEGLAGRRVLDLGCGYGLLALLAARAGAEVVALDDDAAAVESARANAERHGLASLVDVRHSDVGSALADGERFDAVLANPPFHVGEGVQLAVPEAFLAAAGRHLGPGGALWLVANRALPYERSLASWAGLELLESGPVFKVLRARR